MTISAFGFSDCIFRFFICFMRSVHFAAAPTVTAYIQQPQPSFFTKVSQSVSDFAFALWSPIVICPARHSSPVE